MNTTPTRGASLTLTQFALRATWVSVAWAALFHLNAWAFSMLIVDRHVSWIFLPAGLRMLGVLWLDWPAVVGLWIGTLATTGPLLGGHLGAAMAIALVSACSPCLAVKLGRRWLRLPIDLAGMRGWHLLALSLASALFNAVLSQTVLGWFGSSHASAGATFAMFCGDVAGTFILLYTAYLALAFYDRLALRRS